MKTKATILVACLLTLCLAAPASAEYIPELNDTILNNISYPLEESRLVKFSDGQYCFTKDDLNKYLDCDEKDPEKEGNCMQAQNFYSEKNCLYFVNHIVYAKVLKSGYQVALVIIQDDTNHLYGGGTAIPLHVVVVQLVDGNVSIAGNFVSDRFNLKKMNLKKNKLELVYEEDKFFDKGEYRQKPAKTTITLDPRINY
jgi:hypothetical protein